MGSSRRSAEPWRARWEEAERRFFGSYETSPRTDFVISGHGRQLGEISYGSLLDLTGDPGRELDRRLAVAAFVSILLAETGA